MADSTAFEAACLCLENSSSLTKLEARGTIRIALKEAGFEAKTATPKVLAAVVQLLEKIGLTPDGIAHAVQAWIADTAPVAP